MKYSGWLLMALLGASSVTASDKKDPYLWLEEVDSKKAMGWVVDQNKISESELSNSPLYKEIHKETLDILNDKNKIKYVSIRGDKVYNFWRDEKSIRGLYREANLKDYLANKPKWETVFDLDEIAKQEDENWVYKGTNCLFPDYELCLLMLSRGGADATVVREFNIKKRKFVENGFHLAEAKSSVSWKDKDSLYVGTNFGKGSLTDSGYPRIAKLWKRGTSIDLAETIFEGAKKSVGAGVYRRFSIHGNSDYAYESTSFYTNNAFLLDDGQQIPITKPESADISGVYKDQLFVQLKKDWKYKDNSFKQGSIITASMKSVKAGEPDYSVFAEPSSERIINSLSFSESYIWVSWLDNVRTVVERFEKQSNGKWSTAKIPLDSKGSISVFGMQEDSDSFFVTYQNFLKPDTLYFIDGKSLKLTELQSLEAKFDSSKLKVEQHFATSKDGTKVPYFLVMNKDTKLDGKNPTLLYGYGGFEVSLRPRYSALSGTAWLSRGGVYALANIRGGGEYGPSWHQSALKENRQRAYEDFEAIARDLISRKVTSPRHLGAQGGSNGGLLMGNMITRSPELFNAIICQVPLLDMKRYNKLLAGASWMAEYGNPDVAEEWQYIKNFSPYHNLSSDKKYPRVLFTTSTRDDRVHPAHARKMVAKMKGMGHDVLYYENIEGGHGGAADNNQTAHLYAMLYSYLFNQLK
jgi:prolyl oligopeptidase